MGNFSFGVNHGNTTNRLVKTLKLELSVDGTVLAETAGSKAGARRWLVPDTARSLFLSISMPFPTDPSKKLIDSIQTFFVASGPPTLLVPVERVTDFVPRLRAAALGATGAPGGAFLFDLDVDFIDTTAYAATLTPPPIFTPANGSRFALLEYTGAAGPACWCVLVPPAVPAVGAPPKVSVFLFLRPSPRKQYDNTDNVSNVLADLSQRYFSDQASVPPTNMFNAGDFPGYLNIGWERQLVASGRAAVLAFPLPHRNAAPYGDTITGRSAKILPSVLVALRDSRAIGADGALIEINKRALGGYSNGGRMALTALGQKDNRALFDEVYLFDPAGFSGFTPTLKTWFDLGGKTLRMIGGGFQHNSMMDFLATLTGSTATVWPPRLDFWYSAAEYRNGISKAGGPSEALTALGTTPAVGSASDTSGIFQTSFTLDPTDPIRKSKLVVALTGGTPSRAYIGFRHTLPGDPDSHGHVVPAPEEVAAVLAAHSLAAKGGGVAATAANFTAIADNVIENEDASERDRIAAVRHEWTAFGGIILDPQVGYKGFLEQCLFNSAL